MRTVLTRVKELFTKIIPPSGGIKTIFLLLIGAVVLAALFWVIDKLVIYYFARSYVDELTNAFGLNKYLARAVLWLSFGAAVVCLRLLTSFSRHKRYIGALTALALLVGHSAALWYATRDDSFSRTDGSALRWYVVTRDAIRYCVGPGTDPLTGRECRPVTPEIAERLQKYESGTRPHRILSSETAFFDPITGNPITWFSAESDGTIKVFDLMGFDPDTGAELKPITAEMVNHWKAQIARRPPNRIDDPDRYGFFDQVSGRPRLWYTKQSTGYEFYDRPGFHPATGEQLKVVDKSVVDDWRASVAATASKKNCYIITRDPAHPVIYGEQPGLDATTGRQCYPVTPQVQERLNEYAKGKLPKKIDSTDPRFFDMRTGEPIVWYSRTKTGEIELFDLMGFHPSTGEELKSITKEIADEWKEKKSHPIVQPKAPNRIEFNTQTVVFDPVTGAPKLWFWRAGKGAYEFFDGPGFHPQNGEPLRSFTRDEVVKYKTELTDLITKPGNVPIAGPLHPPAAPQSSPGQDVTRCDELAANPNDPKHVGNGVPYDRLKFVAAEAVNACVSAVQQNSDELRFKYQLARAMEVLGEGTERKQNRQRAIVIHEDLVTKGYPAAFDNLGSLYRWDRKDIARAAAIFRRGVRLGDSDSMLSLADMIERNQVPMLNPSEQPIDLYKRAAELGNENGARAYQELAGKIEGAEPAQQFQQQQVPTAQELQQREMMLQFLGAVLRNVH